MIWSTNHKVTKQFGNYHTQASEMAFYPEFWLCFLLHSLDSCQIIKSCCTLYTQSLKIILNTWTLASSVHGLSYFPPSFFLWGIWKHIWSQLRRLFCLRVNAIQEIELVGIEMIQAILLKVLGVICFHAFIENFWNKWRCLKHDFF